MTAGAQEALVKADHVKVYFKGKNTFKGIFKNIK
mgnify:FL=1